MNYYSHFEHMQSHQCLYWHHRVGVFTFISNQRPREILNDIILILLFRAKRERLLLVCINHPIIVRKARACFRTLNYNHLKSETHVLLLCLLVQTPGVTFI